MSETVLQPKGRLDSTAVPDFERQLADGSLIGNEKLLIDLSRIDFIGSSALRAILATAKRLAANGGRLAVCAPLEIAQVFAASGLQSILHVHLTLANARGALAAPRGAT